MPFGKNSLSAPKRQNGMSKWRGPFISVAATVLISGCAVQNAAQIQPAGLAAPQENIGQQNRIIRKSGQANSYSQAASADHLTERSCLERAMFFESNRSSREGLIAVGTVVMNRVSSSQYPDTICGVVGQKNQFAPGVLRRPMNIALIPDVAAAADAVLHGARNPKLKNVMHFHTTGLRFPYNNMHYVMVAGGNSFYEKRDRFGKLAAPVHDEFYNVAYAFAQDRGEVPSTSSVSSVAKDTNDTMQMAYSPELAADSAVEAANTSLNTVVYDNRSKAEQATGAEETQTVPVSYRSDTVPVPQVKASYDTGNMKLAPNMVSGEIKEEEGSLAGKASFSYKAPDVDKVGEVGALLLNDRP